MGNGTGLFKLNNIILTILTTKTKNVDFTNNFLNFNLLKIQDSYRYCSILNSHTQLISIKFV